MTVDRDSIALKIRKYESLFSLKYKHCYFTDKRVTYNSNIRLNCGIGLYGDNERWIARAYFEDNVTFCDCCNYVDIFDNIISLKFLTKCSIPLGVKCIESTKCFLVLGIS